MDDTLSADPRKLEWSGKLCILLLNDGTNAMRWFLKENLPRKYQKEPSLNKILQKNQSLLLQLSEGPNSVINKEMFDLLYREDIADVNEADLEIYLIFVLIRYLCKIKPFLWKWWDEEPRSYQTAPIFDVIRLFRFKERMKDVVHDYKITKETFEASWKYILAVLDRMNAYKLSTRRRLHDVVEDVDDVKTYVRALNVMRWQTMPIKRREELYLSLKAGYFCNRAEPNGDMSSWSKFISQFGQMRASAPTRLDLSKTEVSRFQNKSTKAFEAIEENAPAWELNAHYISSLRTYGKDELQKKKNGNKDEHLLPEVARILNSVNNNVFIEEPITVEENVENTARLLRDLYITRNNEITPLPFEHHYTINMDKVSFTVSQVENSRDQLYACCQDLPFLTLHVTKLTTWQKMLSSKDPLRLLISGERSQGKTTMLRKITYDWATRNVTNLQRYKLLFYIDMALVKINEPYTSLSECVNDQCLKNLSLSQIEEIFNSTTGDGILLLFDGVDYMPDMNLDQMSELSEVICGKRWQNCSVIVTTNFTRDFSDDDERKIYRNAFNLFEKSLHVWKRIILNGFETRTVVEHAKSYFAWKFMNKYNANISARKFLNFCKVFQRDVYKGTISDPFLTFLLAYLWQNTSGIDDDISRQQPETLSESIRFFFKSINIDESDALCLEEILTQVLNSKGGGAYKLEKSQLTDKLKKAGLLNEERDQYSMYRFSYHAFEDYVAVQCLLKSKTVEAVGQILQNYITKPIDAIRLRNFLIFSSSLSKPVADQIISILTNFLKENLQKDDFKSRHQLESVKHLILQCIYEMNPTFPPSVSSFGNENSDLNWGEEMRLERIDLLSNRSKQALYFLTTQCRPFVTIAGTVFPYTDVSPFWIRCIHLSCLRGDQLGFISKIVKNLPFLQEAKFDEVLDVKDEDISQFCEGFKYKRSNPSNKSVLHHLTFEMKFKTIFDKCWITSFLEFGDLFSHLPYLDQLYLTIPTAKLFFSLFEASNCTVVPLISIDLSNQQLKTEECCCMASLISRLIFLENLNLSKNYLQDGIIPIARKFTCLQKLRELNLSKSCLSIGSIEELAENLHLVPTVSRIDVSDNFIQDIQTMIKLVKALKSLKNLQYLDLSSNLLADEGACTLAKILSVHCSIVSLFLCYVQMKSIGLSSLRIHLRDCEKLRVIKLAGNYFSKNMLSFTQALCPTQEMSEGLKNLNILDLSGVSKMCFTSVDSSTIGEFLNSIRDHKNLQYLIFKNVLIDSNYLPILLEGCESHSSLKEIHLSKNLVNLNENASHTWNCLKLI